MPDIHHLNPPSLSTPRGYTHVVTARGQRLIFVAGQIAFDGNGELVGRDNLREQAAQVYENIQLALTAVGAGLNDVVKLNSYVVNYTPDMRPILAEVRGRYFPPDRPPASTLVGVTSLALDGLLIEIEAVAVTD